MNTGIFQRATGKQYYKIFQISYQYQTMLALLESYYQTILTYSELISNSIHTFTELLSNNNKHFFESLNGHFDRQKILNREIPK